MENYCKGIKFFFFKYLISAKEFVISCYHIVFLSMQSQMYVKLGILCEFYRFMDFSEQMMATTSAFMQGQKQTECDLWSRWWMKYFM